MEFKSQICTTKRIKRNRVYALKGNELLVFNSVLEAAEKTGINKDKIYKCCNAKVKCAGGYVWSYSLPDILTDAEEWRDVKGYENLYQVNRKGEVRSCHNGYWKKLSAGIAKRGYRHFLLHKEGGRKNVRGCRLVAEAFIPNPNNLPFVNHKDENPTNDRVENLEWCTHKYNINYGTTKVRISQNNGKNRLVCMFNVDGAFIREFYNINEAAKYINGRHTCIARCCCNKVFCYKGYIWRYKEDVDSIADAIRQYKKSKTTNKKIEVKIKGQIKIFNSMSQASKELGISRDTLRKYNNLGEISWKII